jgi:DNA-binding MarR family transcriptional regulator
VPERTEPATPPLDEEEEAFLRAFARVSISLPRAMEADLLRELRLTLSDYFTLMHLSEAEDRRLRMSDLAAAGALSLSGMTRIVNRLEAGGLIRRERSAEDARGWHAVLTDTGLERLERAWPAHLASVRRHLFDHLGGIDLGPITLALTSATADSAGAAVPCADEGSALE